MYGCTSIRVACSHTHTLAYGSDVNEVALWSRGNLIYHAVADSLQVMHRSQWWMNEWMNEWTDSDTSLRYSTTTEGCVSNDFFRHSLDDSPASYLTQLLPSLSLNTVELIVIHNRPVITLNENNLRHRLIYYSWLILIHCLSSSDSTVHPEKSASWELPRNSFLTCYHLFWNGLDIGLYVKIEKNIILKTFLFILHKLKKSMTCSKIWINFCWAAWMGWLF